ncbi:Myb-like_DNA-binding domain-containing protein [Hexamita inflata]|uniref:Myb-like DNA-binding domain-containing protein n=1 Tax=Hexamita inflata TaxID=28002 RepID=A0AA86QLA5_9EUKA|nr:Myb-like DNA-binding domain-containing protein [Hexamita inflata]
MKTGKQLWSKEEIAALIKLTEQNRQNNSKIIWSKISAQLKSRSEIQCKSYYQIIIKPSLQCSMRTNHSWSRLELVVLWTLGVNFSADFECIQKTQPMFAEFTVKQLQSQWQQCLKKQNEYLSVFKRLLMNEICIQSISDLVFPKLLFIIKICFEYASSYEEQKQNLNGSEIQFDKMEVNAVRAFLSGIHFAEIHKLFGMFREERKRRRIDWQNM